MHSRNRAALSYTLALNHLADRTPQELAALRGRRRSGAPNNGQPFPTELYAGLILPESLDWRLYGEDGAGASSARARSMHEAAVHGDGRHPLLLG